jgi:hypothetical protein
MMTRNCTVYTGAHHVCAIDVGGVVRLPSCFTRQIQFLDKDGNVILGMTAFADTREALTIIADAVPEESALAGMIAQSIGNDTSEVPE